MADWCLIESDPGVFTELIQSFGVKDVQVEELYGIDTEELQRRKPVHGLIFLFKWVAESDDRAVEADYGGGPFFAKQVINNACATQALLNILLNCPDVEIGEELANFKSFTQDLPSDMRGEAIGGMDSIRINHNNFARPEPFMRDDNDKRVATKDDDVFHFIAYVPHKGKVYELDGLKPGPIALGECGEGEDWITTVQPHIQQRIERYATSEIRFNLMAITNDPRPSLTKRKTALDTRVAALEGAAGTGPGVGTGAGAATFGNVDNNGSFDQAAFDAAVALATKEELESAVNKDKTLLRETSSSLSQEKSKFDQWHTDNIRRKHNYVPLVVALFRQLAKHDKLDPMIEQAKEKQKIRQAEAVKAKAAAGAQ